MKTIGLIILFISCTTAQLSNLQCGHIGYSKRLVLENPSPRSIDSCQYTIEAYSSNTCQLLIRLEKFELKQPVLRDASLECVDYFEVGDFKLCGSNNDQHLYVPFEGREGNNFGRKTRISMGFQLPSRWSQNRWRLVISQLECPHTLEIFPISNLPVIGVLQNVTRQILPPPSFGDFDLLAPAGCHQYFTLSMGTIRSFNFNPSLGGLYMPNMSYVICVKAASRQAGRGSVQKIDYTFEKFSMSVEDITKAGYDADCRSTILTLGRRSDYLMIPQSTLPNLESFTPSHYCGRSLNGHQVIASAPFVIYFRSDNLSDPTETGFIIHYRVK